MFPHDQWDAYIIYHDGWWVGSGTRGTSVIQAGGCACYRRKKLRWQMEVFYCLFLGSYVVNIHVHDNKIEAVLMTPAQFGVDCSVRHRRALVRLCWNKCSQNHELRQSLGINFGLLGCVELHRPLGLETSQDVSWSNVK